MRHYHCFGLFGEDCIWIALEADLARMGSRENRHVGSRPTPAFLHQGLSACAGRWQRGAEASSVALKQTQAGGTSPAFENHLGGLPCGVLPGMNAGSRLHVTCWGAPDLLGRYAKSHLRPSPLGKVLYRRGIFWGMIRLISQD